jgi:hypothetical protein
MSDLAAACLTEEELAERKRARAQEVSPARDRADAREVLCKDQRAGDCNSTESSGSISCPEA